MNTTRNIQAAGLTQGQFRPQTVPNKKRYDRKRDKRVRPE